MILTWIAQNLNWNKNCIFGIFSLKYVPFESRYPPGWVYDPSKSNEMVFESISVQETWTAMENLVTKGLVR